MKKRSFSVLLPVVLLAALLVGCGVEAAHVPPPVIPLPSVAVDAPEPAPEPAPAPAPEPAPAPSHEGDRSPAASQGAVSSDPASPPEGGLPETAPPAFSLDMVPAYSGQAYIPVNDNMPLFTRAEQTGSAFERYSQLDELGRCGTAYACVGRELMPTGERGSIGSVRPSGWHTVRYDDLVEGNYLYNRCHLIGYQLTGENANGENLITGTRYLNIEGMLPFENLVADYVKETGGHVMYRVTPVFAGDELLARGVLMEGWSVEDGGEGVCFCVYAYNVQPGVDIDYATGESVRGAPAQQAQASDANLRDYILNSSSMKFHDPACPGAADIKAENRQVFHGARGEAVAQGYQPCGRCKP